MTSLLSQCLHSTFHNQPCCRRALLTTSTVLSSAQTKKGKQPERSEFKRDELPHSGRPPAPERGRRVDPSWMARGARRRTPADRRGPPTGTAFRPKSADASRPSSRDASSSRHGPNSRRSVAGNGQYHHRIDVDYQDRRVPSLRPGATPKEAAAHRALFNSVFSPVPDQRTADPRRSAPDTAPRTPRYLSQPPPSASLDADTPTTFSNTREDRELEEGAYDTPEAADEFFHPAAPVTRATPAPPAPRPPPQRDPTLQGVLQSLPDVLDADPFRSSAFTSPPLLPGFVSALREMFGRDVRPTPIQSLSIVHCLPSSSVHGAPGWKQFLLASETGSGKSIAYLLPLLQGIKTAELAAADATPPSDEQVKAPSQRALNPRGLVLAPTHELARQLAGFAKALLHDVKLRVLCASRANEKSTAKRADASAAQMAAQFAESAGAEGGALDVKRGAGHPVGAVVGTPMKLLEMVRGRGWDRIEEDEAQAREEEDEDGVDEEGRPRIKPRRGRDKMVHYGTWRAKPELGLANVEWVVVDEADVLFDPDFQETTRTLLADISAARGHVLTPSASIPVPPTLGQPTSPSTLSNPLPTPPAPTSGPSTSTPTSTTPIDYPFNLILTSATIPKSLNAYLTAHHPALVRLASPQLHRLPRTLQTEYVGWTGGNKFADVVRRIRRVWAEDAAGGHAAAAGAGAGAGGRGGLSKILVFCNRSAKVEEFAAYLEAQGVRSVAMTSRSAQRGRGSNRHLAGFLRQRPSSSSSSSPSRTSFISTPPPAPADPRVHPHVLITTSLLSRGLDFAPDIRHVFVVDEPRNTVDFLHRAGRTGRAGAWGKVVIFGKLKGRGSQRTKEVRKRIQGLRAV